MATESEVAQRGELLQALDDLRRVQRELDRKQIPGVILARLDHAISDFEFYLGERYATPGVFRS